MSFADCIDTAITTGKIKAAKGEEAKKVYAEARAEAEANGLSDRAADDWAAVKSVERLATMTHAKKWQKVNEIRVAAKIWDEFSTTNKPVEAIIRLGDSIDIAKERILGQMHMLLEKNLEKWRPRAAGLIHPTRDMNDIVYASFGEPVKDASARELYEEIMNLDTFTRRRANMEGASIHKNENRRLGQMQDRMKLVDLKARLGPDAAKQEWLAEHLDGLDWDMMRYHGGEMPVDQREAILERSYRTILSEGDVNLTPGHTGEQGLATRLGHERFFYYKDAATWIKMQEKYGAGNVWLQVVSSMETMARDIATMEHLGPNPLIMKNYLNNVARQRATQIDEGSQKKRTMRSKVIKELETFDERYRIHNHLVNNGAESILAQSMAPVHTLVTTALLDSAFISNLGDLNTGVNTLLFNKLPAMGYMKKVLKTFAQMPVKERRIAAIRNGFGYESATSMVLAQTRYLGAFEGPQVAKRVADTTFRATFLVPWTQASRWAWGGYVQGVLADNAGKQMDELPFASFMRAAGITSDEWDMMRAVPLFDDRGAPMLRPNDLRKVEDIDSIVRQRVADKFIDWILDMQRRAVPSVDTRVAAALGAGVDANTVRGQVLRTFGAVRSFPTLIWMLHIRDAMMLPTVGGRLGGVARLISLLTLGGMFITQMKELIEGRDFRDMTDPGFMVRSLLNGGSLGIAGDALYVSPGGFKQRGLSELFAGPIPEFFEATKGLVWDNPVEILNGKDTKFTRELLEWTSKYLPIPWQGRLMLQRAILEDLMMQADPGAYRRMKLREAKRFKDLKQRSWWPSGQKLPTRAPSLSAAVGIESRR